MAYNRVTWKDYPETDTPLTASNLNKMDEGIYDIAEDIGDMDKISDEADGTVCGNLDEIRTNAEGINIFVGDDGKLHFKNFEGADSVIPFSANKDYRVTISSWYNFQYGLNDDMHVSSYSTCAAKAFTFEIEIRKGAITSARVTNNGYHSDILGIHSAGRGYCGIRSWIEPITGVSIVEI